ncbi:MAG TPA: hypothetical protein VFT39_01340 [Vicinamibacterales bacterium]|nr:hypothetical protein [Vicinamibacterales bacterium]
MSRTKRLTELDERIVAAAEADLQQLLSIEPSPEFTAKVRARIDDNRESRAWKRWGWIGLAVATAAAVILAVALRPEHTAAPHGGVANARPDDNLRAPSRTDDTTAPAPKTTLHPVARHRSPARAAEPGPNPEIIIDPAMTDAIRRMAIALRNTSPDVSVAESLHVEEGDPAALKVAEPLDVPELVVKPAEQNGGSQNPL